MESVTSFLKTLANKGVKLSAEAGRLNCYAQKGALTNEIRDGLARYKSEIIALLEDGQNRRQAHIDNGFASGSKEFPLSVGEKGIYIHQKLRPEMSAYNVPLCFRLNSELNVEILAKAWERTLEQFPILTARVIENDADLYHRLDDGCKTTIQRRSIDFADDQQLLPFLKERAKEPFDLNRGPLTRIELFTQGERKSILLITVHHIVFDGTSAMVLLKSFFTFYQQLLQGEPVRLSRDLVGYQEFVAGEEAMLASAEGAAHAAYWRRQLAGELPVIEPFSDLPRSASPDFEGKTLVEDLPEDLSYWVRDFAKTHSFLPSAIFLGVFQLLLHRYANQDDIIVGMPVTVRTAQKFAAEIGYFVNMVPLRAGFEERLKLGEFLHRTQRAMLDALHHSSYPFQLMLEKSKTKQTGKDPIYQVTYAYQNFTSQAGVAMLLQQSPNLDLEYVTEITQEDDSDLGLEIFEKEALFSMRLKYNPELYSRDAINRFFEHYCGLLKGISENQDLLPHEYSIVTESEKYRLLVEYNATEAEYPKDKCVHHLFEEQVERSPDAVAVVFEDQALTYRELNARTNRVARYLRAIGVGSEKVVALLGWRSIDLLTAIIGVMKAGAAYLPLDPYDPGKRHNQILQQSKCVAALASAEFISGLRRASESMPSEERPIVVSLDELLEREQNEANPPTCGRPKDLAYVIYTSGSTGAPKGVMIEQGGMINHLYAKIQDTQLTAADTLAQIASQCFDSSVWQFLAPLIVGGRVHIFGEEAAHDPMKLMDHLEQGSVTILSTVPSMLRAMLEAIQASGQEPGERKWKFSKLKCLLEMGEALPVDLCRQWMSLYPKVRLINAYGLTECSDDVTHYVVTEMPSPGQVRVSIGGPLANTRFYVLDNRLEPAPVGVIGELYVGGVATGRGYLHAPELTASKFVPDPFGVEPGARLYKSGDLARYLRHGELDYLGRMDHQVKIRGFRIELGEIEARLNQHLQVQDCAVVAPGEGAETRLIAFYRAKETTADQLVELPKEELRAHVLKTLPEYMAPAVFVSLAAIPLNSNGKVDRRALTRMDVATESAREYLAPRNQTERRLVEIWAEVLNLAPEKVGINDNFFDLGGHSLLATRLISKIRSRLEVDLPLKALFESGSVAQLAQLIAKAEKSEIPPILPVDRSQFDRLPLSFAQERLWFIDQLEPESAGYNVPGAFSIKGELDIDQLEQAFNLIIARHENLRTVFPSRHGQAHQLILESLDFKLERIDVSHHETRKERDEMAKQLCQTEAATPFDLARGPLIRGKVIKLAEDERILALNMHHIVSDGWSLGVLINELGLMMEGLRQGRQAELSPLPIQYVDYSVWQRQWLEEGGVLKRQLAYWQEKLAGVPESLNLPTDYPRPSVQSFAGATQAFALDAQLTGRLKRLADEQGVTLFMVLLAAFKALLYRYTGQEDVCVGSPIANRQYGETEGLIGMFVNTLALRSRVSEDDTFAGLLSQVKATCLEAYEHQDAPFEKVVEMARPQRNMAVSPIFQVMLVLQNVDEAPPDERVQRYPFEIGVSKFDLSIEFAETPEGLAGSIEYSTALYKPQTIGRMVEHFIALSRAISVTPNARIRDLEYLGAAEKRKLLIDFNATQAEYPEDKCIHQLFVEQVAINSERTALVCGDEHLTYRRLYARSRDLALYLQSEGVGPESLVGLCVERSPDMAVGLLGILQAGGAYVPLDPDYPAERLAYMLQDSRATIVLTQKKYEDKIRSLSTQDARLITLDEQWPDVSKRVGDLKTKNIELRREVKPDNLAYVIYTSGTTGNPKGVAVTHHSVCNQLRWAGAAFNFGDADRFLQKATFSFDASVVEIFLPLVAGGQLIAAQAGGERDAEYLVELVAEEGITCIDLSPSLLQALLSIPRITSCNSVRLVFSGGEVLMPELVEAFALSLPHAQLWNTYGPTETTVQSTFASDLGSARVIPIGKPLANTQVYVADRVMNVQPVGVGGELYIGGAGLARGYWERPDLTAARFLPDPFGPDRGARLYRTGDLTRWLDDGAVQYLGRIDAQVKIRGFRIELGEIEARLNEHHQIQDSAVISRGEGVEKQLIAFYRAKGATSDQIVHLASEELRAHLLRTLPEYMAPAAFVSLTAIPLNPNGKVDRRALARMDVEIESGREYQAPRNETERRLVEIWAQVLNLPLEKIGVNDNFFELGGHSLLATQLVSKIRSRLDVDLPLKALFESGSVAQLAQLVAKAEKSDIPPIRPVDRTQFNRLPLSFAQERLWFIDQLEPESAGYNIPGAATIRGELDVDQLEQAFNLIIARHENLRTIFPSQDGRAQQLIMDSLDFKLERIDLSHYTDKNARDNEAKQLCQADAATPFNLARGPLIRGKAIKLAEQEYVLMLNMHHIISDGWSLGVLIKELGLIMEAFREGRRPELPTLPIQYADYSVWQRKRLEEGGVLKRQLAYWQEKLAGVPESLDLPTDYPRPSVQSFTGATLAFALDAELTGRLKSLADQQGGTLYMVLLAAFKALLYRYTGQEDLCVGSAIANRQYGETEGLIGMFVNTMALRSRVDGGGAFAGLLSQVKATCLETYEHQDAPFEKVVEAVRPQRNMAVSPLFQVMVILQNVDEGAPDPHIQRCPLEMGVSKFDLTVEFTETQEGLAGSIEYSTALYKPQTIGRMADHFIALCRAIIATPSARIYDLDYLSEAEKHELLVGFNDPRADFPKDVCLHQLFVEQVALHSGKTAVVCGDEQLTYQQLYERSQNLALYLQSQGVKPDGLVGLCMERSLDMVVSLLGILQAGGAYVPLDPDYPDERLAYMLQDSQAAIILTQEKLQDKLSGLIPAEAQLIALDRQWSEIRDRVAELKAKKVRLQPQVKPQHLAYVIYTSGSTGAPKGVMVEHANVARLFSATDEWFRFNEDDVWTLFHSYAFDFSVWEIWGALLYGGRLVIVPKNIARSPQEFYKLLCFHKVTVLNQTPSAFRLLITAQGESKELHQLRYIIFGGEALEVASLKPWYEQNQQRHTRLINMYGITETTVHVTYRPLEPADTERRGASPIGRRIPDLRTYILDPQRQPAPIGVAGELYVSGAGVARGYLNRPELTMERFVRDPFAAEPGARMYKTGDLVRWLDDGDIQYLGRIDTQVKIRGFRIELGEIEARLDQHPGIEDSAVIAQGAGADKRLIAFYRAKGATSDRIVQLPNEELRAHLLQTLPDYMAPAAFVSLAAIPLTTNGKVDRRALARMDVTIESDREYQAPRNETERRLVEIWAQALNLPAEKIGVNDNFFELGGHSLLATQLVSKIRSGLDVDLPLKALFERGSVAELYQLVAKAEKSDIPPVRPVDRTQFDRLPLSFAQERLWFIDQLEPESAGYNLPVAVTVSGEMDIDQLEQAFNLIIARHENLRTVFPSQDGQARQLILDSLDFKLERIDLSHYKTKEERREKAKQLCQADAVTPFDLARGPLIRGKVIKVAEQERILMLNMHHIISDGWSIGVLIKEFGLIMDAFRQGRRPELAPLPIQYVDYSVWQRQWLEEGGVLKRQLAYWQGKLAGVPESLDLPTDYSRPSVQSFAGATQTFALDAQLTGRLRRLADEQGVTLYMVLLAAFKVLLHRYTGQNDICVGSPIANRQYGETEGLIGMFVNILALRSQVESGEPFAALLSQVKNTCLEAYQHQDAPFERVVDLLQPQRNLAISPLFQVTITLQNASWAMPNPSIQSYSLDSCISKFDLGFDFTETTEGLAGLIEYSTALYKPQTIARMVEHFVALCRAITVTPSAKVRDLDYLSEAEKHELLVGFNDTQADFPKDKCIHQLFVEQVARCSEKTAVVCGNERLTYQELYAISRDLALYLQSEGVGPDTPVGLCMERSLEMVVSLLGILQAGGAYVPLDPDYPDERLTHMLLDSRTAIVLTQEKLLDKLATLVTADTRLVALDRQWSEIDDRVAVLKAENVQLQERVEPHHLAYVIYTSGSTGRPKGVMNEHRGVVNRLIWMQRAYRLDMEDAVLQKTPFSFDVSVWEFFWPLLAGARLVMARPEGHKDPAYLVDTIRRNRITTLHFVPPMLQVFLEHAEAAQCLSLTRVICSGEALPSMLVRRFAERLPHARLYNLYGPTEAAVDVTAWTCPSEEIPSIIPIGRPIANTQMYILDERGALVPIGVAGELHIGGVQVARGYLNRPDLTAERFVRDPFAAEAEARMYKTGDLARWREDGTIEFLGRNDFQVKIRGFRIELGEIEARLMEHQGVLEAVVVAREDTPGEKRLVAYYTPSPAYASPVVQLLRLRKTGAGAAANYCTLPNGLPVFHHNQSETDFVYDEIFNGDGYLRHGVTLNDGDCVFDVGANIGLFSLFVGQRCRNATIYAFEPIPLVFETLRLNSRLHGWAGKLYECGLAETSKRQVFTFYPHNTVISSSATSRSEARQIVKSYLLKRQEGADFTNGRTVAGEGIDELLETRLESEEYTCQMRTVSEIIEENGIERIDLLKIDVEKAEHDVLKGIKDGDWPKIKQLVIEAHDVSGRLGEIVALLEARGYEVSYEQSQSLEQTGLYNLYACRPAIGKGSSNGHRVGKRVDAERFWGSPESLVRDVRAFLSERLPDYMTPAAYVPLDEMPLTPNGKLDRKALPAPEAGSVASRVYEEPQGEIEATLARIWSDVLKVERIGRNDNFFEIGGHSLLAAQLMAKTNRHFKQMLPLAVFFTAPNIAAFAKLITSEEAPAFDILVPIQTNGDAPPVFAVPGVGGNVLSLQPLSKVLGAKQPLYALQAVGLDGKTPPFESVEQTAQANIAALKKAQPCGPYSLIGHSYGGVVAYEMARILLEQGEGISSLILLDSIAPSVMQGTPADDEATEIFEACAAMANLYGANLKIDLNRLRQSSSTENVQYIVNLLNDHGLEINDEQFAAFLAVFLANQFCYRAYKPSMLSREIDVSLYRATQGHQDGSTMPRDYGWNQLLQSPIRIYDVEANHFSILEKARLQ